MNYFLKANKNLLTYSLILFIVIPIFGINFLLSFLGNILLLIFLIPLLFLLLLSKINKCGHCGAISIGLSTTCTNCGADLDDISKRNKLDKKPSESTIDVNAEVVN